MRLIHDDLGVSVEMKILPTFYKRIIRGVKRWEIRSMFPTGVEQADWVRYVDAETGRLLGYHAVKNVTYITVACRERLKQVGMRLGAISSEEYDSLFADCDSLYAINIDTTPLF